jgi:hypothetical protein
MRLRTRDARLFNALCSALPRSNKITSSPKVLPIYLRLHSLLCSLIAHARSSPYLMYTCLYLATLLFLPYSSSLCCSSLILSYPLSTSEPFQVMMARQASRRMGELQRPTPTAETQELYNKMRRAEERLTIESMHQIQTGSSGRSPPLSTSPGTATPTSASYDSTTQSISQVMDGVTVGEDPSQAVRSRCGRHGPLPEAKKLRAALLRKLKACDDCRARKVKV